MPTPPIDSARTMQLALAASVSYVTARAYVLGRRSPSTRTVSITARLDRAAAELGIVPIAPAPSTTTTDAARADSNQGGQE